MTKIKVVTRNKHFFSIEVDGHTGYSESGSDIVCAAISSIVQTALLGLLQVAGVNVEYTRRDDDAFLSYKLPELSGDRQIKAWAIADTMLLGLQDLYEQFSDFMEMEVN